MYSYLDKNKEHLHLLGDKPLIGTSTIGDILSKTLTYWASGLALAKFGWIKKKDEDDKLRSKEERLAHASAVRIKNELLSDEEYLNLLDEGYKAHAEKLEDSASDGTELHAELERYVKYTMDDREAKAFDVRNDKIIPFMKWASENVKRFILSEAHVYSERMWTGGILDCLAELNDGTIGILDFKSAKRSYINHFFQCAGYSIQLRENGAVDKDGKLIYNLEKPLSFFAVIPFGKNKFSIDFRYNLVELEEGFEAMLKLYKIINNSKK